MYTRWKQLKEEFGIKKEYIKSIRKRVLGETHLKEIIIEDEEGTKILILYCLYNKTYEVLIGYEKIGLDLSTPVLKWNEDPYYYELLDADTD